MRLPLTHWVLLAVGVFQVAEGDWLPLRIMGGVLVFLIVWRQVSLSRGWIVEGE